MIRTQDEQERRPAAMRACAGVELGQALSRVRDAITGRRSQLSAMIGAAMAIVEGLAAELGAIEEALEDEAYLASRYGVRIGTDGQPPPAVEQAERPGPSSPAEADDRGGRPAAIGRLCSEG